MEKQDRRERIAEIVERLIAILEMDKRFFQADSANSSPTSGGMSVRVDELLEYNERFRERRELLDELDDLTERVSETS